MNVRPGPGIGRPRVDQPVRIGLAPGEQLLRRGRGLLDLVRVVLEQRTRGHERDLDALVLRELLHLRRGGLVIRHQVGEFRRIRGQQLDQQALLDAGGQEIGAGQHQVDVAAARALHRLQLAGSSGAGALVKLNLATSFGFFFA